MTSPDLRVLIGLVIVLAGVNVGLAVLWLRAARRMNARATELAWMIQLLKETNDLVLARERSALFKRGCPP